MKIRFISDLHCEFDIPAGIFNIPENEDDKNTVLILAGDIGVMDKPRSLTMIADQAHRFRSVIYVIGNHEHYGGSFKRTETKIINLFSEYKNLYLLENDFHIIDDVVFIGATLWTDFDNYNQLTMYDASLWMNDYKKIRTGSSEIDCYKKKLKPEDIIQVHFNSKKYIFDSIKFYKSQGKKVVVITHMGPSFLSIHENFKNDNLNGCFVSSLEEDILDTKPDIWIHGHVHTSFDYMIGNTRILTNPRGYVGYKLNREFEPEKFIEL